MKLFCVGLSHHTANVETRERFCAGDAAAVRSFGNGEALREALVLSTCNRVELYAATPEAISTEQIAAMLTADGAPLLDGDLAAFYRHDADECVEHLFRVASGLDSMVVGETEILGQTKKAYATARESGATGPFLNRLFQRAFRAAKQVRTHTEITRGPVSVGAVAVELAEKIFGDLSRRTVLLIGAGETSERTARALVSRGVRHIAVSNRSGERATALAELVGGRAIPWEHWENECRAVDILITSTSAPAPLLTRATLEPLLRDRLDRPLFVIDIAVPRDVDPEINELEGVYLYDIDSLQLIAERSLDTRRQQVALGEAIIERHVADFAEWFARVIERETMDAEPFSPSTLGEASAFNRPRT